MTGYEIRLKQLLNGHKEIYEGETEIIIEIINKIKLANK